MIYIFRMPCSTSRFNRPSPEYLCDPYRSGVGKYRLKALLVITVGYSDACSFLNCLLDSDVATSGYIILGIIEKLL